MFLLIAQTQVKEAVVVPDHIIEGGEPAVMEKAALCVCPKPVSGELLFRP